MKTKLSRNPFIVLGAFVVLLWLLLSMPPWMELVLVAVLWALILLMSFSAVVRIYKRGMPSVGYGQISVMPKRIRRWIYDEPDLEKDPR